MAEAAPNVFSNFKPIDPFETPTKALGLANQAQQLDTSKFELALKQLNVLRGTTASFLSDPEAGKSDLTKKVQDQVSKLVGMGLYTPAQAMTFLKGFPANPQEQYKMLVRTHAETLSASEQLGALFGPPSETATGGGMLTKQTPGYPGLPVRERGFVRGGLPPTATTPNPDSQQPEYLGGTEPPVVEQRPGSLSQIPGAPASRPPARPGSLVPVERPAAQAMPVAPAVAPPIETPRPAAATPPGRIPAAFPQGSEQETSRSGEALAGAREQAGGYQHRVNPTRQAIEIVAKMDPKDIGAIGPGSEAWNRLRSAALTWGLGEIGGIDPNKVADHNKLKKYFEDAASRRASGIGPKTNDGLASALTASPNMKLDKLAVNDLLKMNLALDRMEQAAILEFDSQRPPVSAGRWNTWKAQFMAKQDPRAFLYDLLPGDKQKKLTEGMSKQQRERFEKSLDLADRHELLGDVRD